MSFTEWKAEFSQPDWVAKLALVPWEDRRKALRVEGSLEVLSDLGTRKILATLLDLSWTGCRIQSGFPIPAGTLSRLSSPQLGHGLKVWCVCRWSCPSPLHPPGQAFWSGHQLQAGPYSPAHEWVRESLVKLGFQESDLLNRRRTNRYSTDIPATVEGYNGRLTSISLFGGCLVLREAILPQPFQLFLAIGKRGLSLECLRRSTRLLPDGQFAHHLTWEQRSQQVRAVAILLRAHGGELL